jgi:hypothetical protein
MEDRLAMGQEIGPVCVAFRQPLTRLQAGRVMCQGPVSALGGRLFDFRADGRWSGASAAWFPNPYEHSQADPRGGEETSHELFPVPTFAGA